MIQMFYYSEDCAELQSYSYCIAAYRPAIGVFRPLFTPCPANPLFRTVVPENLEWRELRIYICFVEFAAAVISTTSGIGSVVRFHGLLLDRHVLVSSSVIG